MQGTRLSDEALRQLAYGSGAAEALESADGGEGDNALELLVPHLGRRRLALRHACTDTESVYNVWRVVYV